MGAGYSDLVESDLLVNLPKGLVGYVGSLFGPLQVHIVEVSLVLHQAFGFFADGAEGLHHGFADGGLEDAIPLSGEFRLDFGDGLAGEGGIDVHQVGDAGLVLLVEPDTVLPVRVGDGTLELPADIVGGVHQENAAVGNGFAHLVARGGEAVDPGAGLGDHRLGNLEHVAVDAVEALGDVPADLHVLFLVFSDGNVIGLVKKDVGCHQDRVSEQTGVDVVFVFGRFVLELGHAGQFPEHRIAVQHPGELAVGGDMRLEEEHVLLRVQAAGDV